MRRVLSIALVVFLALSPAVGQLQQASADDKNDDGPKLSQADKDAVKQAITDEMYVNNLQPYVIDVGKEISRSEYQLNIYLKPSLNKDKVGWVIYKLMPFGQVYRLFSIRSDGLVLLYGKLRDHFPSTQPSYLTVYMDDEDLCQMEREWQKEHVTVELKPSAEHLSQARARQKERERA